MKLKRLQFEGIGSFADRMEIDFETLGSAGLFLIEGPTGSGKSTILDAIVFALYGSVAGANSDLGRLDSHLRDRSCVPFVELDFECGGALYRIRRSPKHERDKLRGNGTTGDNGSVALIRMRPDPVDIGHKVGEVGEWVLQTVGLTKQQFVSTVVLAQGEFASFLDADTADRARILEKVFGTEFYTRVEDQLVAMRKNAAQSRAAAADLAAAAVHECQGGLGLDDEVDLRDPLPALDQALEQLRAELADAQTVATAAEEALQKARADHTGAVILVDQQQTKRHLLAQQQTLTAQRDEVDATRQAVQDHNSAAPLVPTIRAWEQAVRETDEAERAAAAVRVDLRNLGVDEEPTGMRVTDVATLLGELRQPVILEAALDAERRKLTGLRSAAERAAADRARIEAALVERTEQIKEAGEQLSGHQDVSERVTMLRVMESDAGQQCDLHARWSSEEQIVAGLRHQVEQVGRQRDEAEATLDAARAAQTRNVAAELASTLVDGQPCMVCGAAEHPAPAVPEEVSSGGLVDLITDLARRELAVSELQQELSQAEGRRQVLGAQLKPGHEQAATTLAHIRAERAELEEQVMAATKLQERIKDLESQKSAASQDLTSAKLREQEASLAVRTTAEVIGANIATVQAASDGHASVADRVQTLEKLHDALEKALSADKVLLQRQEAFTRARELLSASLAEAGFADVSTARARLLDEVTRDGYEQMASAWDKAVAEVARDLGALVDVDLGTTVDVAGLQAAAAQCQESHVRVTRTVNSLDDRIARAVPKRRIVEERVRDLEQVRERTAAVMRMADLATANRSEVVHKVRLSSFVLMRRFQSVVEAANDRLDAISEGRYQLVVESHGLDKRGQAGLDLLIEDQRTEKCRSTKSLSGGERFYVSLALALGLADVVRSESGGVELGTLFIDEGFGSLDVDVLEEVMDMLEAVRVGEDRVIGLISHVEILKQRIDPRISVRRDLQRPGISTLQVRV